MICSGYPNENKNRKIFDKNSRQNACRSHRLPYTVEHDNISTDTDQLFSMDEVNVYRFYVLKCSTGGFELSFYL